MTLGLNPRYVAYANAHGMTPAKRQEADRVEWPGAVMCGFVLWNNARLREASREIPDAFYLGRIIGHAAYDEWLLTKYPEPVPAV